MRSAGALRAVPSYHVSVKLKAALVFVFLSQTMSAPAQEAALEPIEYRLSFPAPESHYVEVEASFPLEGRSSLDVMMPVWTPGSYLVREYSRHVEDLRVLSAGRQDPRVDKVSKNRWRIENLRGDRVKVAYRVYCRESSVRTNWVEADFAILNGAPTFITLAQQRRRPHLVEIRLPDAWKQTWTGLEPQKGGRRHRYRAADFDELVDCPILAGNPAVHSFEVDGVPHYLVNHGEGGLWDGRQAARDVEKIVRQQIGFWGQIPYRRYVFLNVINESGGGLEHRNSTLMMTSRWSYRDKNRYRRWLGLVSHEFFHTWNVKRLRPVELGPFDYERENYTTGLWIAEGITSYYTNLILRRAGLIDDKQWLEGLSGQIGRVQNTPGRKVRPLAVSSFDAWIKSYRPDENSVNTNISYYTKGAVVGFLLDAEIRRLSQGRRSLDDVMRLAYQRFSGQKGFTPSDFEHIASEVAGADLGDFFDSFVEGADELQYDGALAGLGLRFKSLESSSDPKRQEKGEGKRETAEKKAWLGLRAADRQGRFVVREVRRDTPAHRFGLNVDDEVVALGGYRVLPGRWEDRLKQYRPGDQVELLISRRGRLRTLDIVFGEKPPEKWKLEIDPDASEAVKAQRQAWLSGNSADSRGSSTGGSAR